jgi:adenylate kinase family enzyme
MALSRSHAAAVIARREQSLVGIERARSAKTFNVIGSSGSGKSHFSRRLAAQLGLRWIELDALHWLPNWTEAPDDLFMTRVADAISGEGWVLDGNYTGTLPLKWARAEVVIWLDYSLARTLARAVRRALERIASQQELWAGTGNRESWRRLFSQESILLWTLQTHAPHRARFAALIADRAYSHITFIRLRTPREAERFFERLSSA